MDRIDGQRLVEAAVLCDPSSRYQDALSSDGEVHGSGSPQAGSECSNFIIQRLH